MGLTLDQGVYLDERGLEELEEIRESSHRLADDVGLVDEQQIVASLPSEKWQQLWPWVRERIGLCNLYGALGFRNSAKARAKAVLLSIGRPATREEIGSVCGIEDGRVGAYLSNVSSVVRADKERWGLREWIDDEYDGIVGEIIQRIKEGGGTTTTERLLKELPNKFGVSPGSVLAYMQTPKFVIQDGWISIASTSSVQLRDLDDVIDGRDDTGAPYWIFPVEARYLDGYSVVGIPPEFARALGCAPDAGERIQIENLPDCRDLSINWRLASNTGASLGYLAEPLKILGLEWRCCTARSKSLTSLMPVAESPGAVRIGHPERGHLVEYLAPNSMFNSLPRQHSCSHLRPDDRFVTIDRVLHHASLGEA